MQERRREDHKVNGEHDDGEPRLNQKNVEPTSLTVGLVRARYRDSDDDRKEESPKSRDEHRSTHSFQ
jgi:hypothetical protein